MELRFIPMRIGNPENILGSRRDGPTPGESSALASMAASWMELRCAGCSSERFAATVCLST